MLTSTQCRVVAYVVDNELICPECVTQQDINEGIAEAYIGYLFESEDWRDGAYCEDCGAELSAPWPIEPDPDEVARFEPED